MRAKLQFIVELVLASYWFVPSLMTIAAIVLSFVMIQVDARFGAEAVGEFGWLLFSGGVEGARGVLESIAGSMVTVTGVVFSITIVALTLASSQFGPRVLANFMDDRGNQIVLGTFLATYLYSLLVLRAVRNGGEDEVAVVPHISITVALLLTLASVGVLIYFIHHVAMSIQAPNLIARVAADLHRDIESLFPEEAGSGSDEVPASLLTTAPEAFDRGATRIEAKRNGYLTAVATDQILAAATERKLLIRLEYRPGHFVERGSTLARVWPAHEVDDELRELILTSLIFGSRRTSLQDVEFTVNQLVEVAVRALSPGINDPFTAVTCIDQLGAALCHLVQRHFPSPYRLDDGGELRIAVGRPLTFSGVVDAAFHQIRQNSSYHVAVHLRLLETLERVVGCAPSVERMEPLLHHCELVWRYAAAQVSDPADRADLEQRYRAVRQVARRRRAELGTESEALAETEAHDELAEQAIARNSGRAPRDPPRPGDP